MIDLPAWVELEMAQQGAEQLLAEAADLSAAAMAEAAAQLTPAAIEGIELHLHGQIRQGRLQKGVVEPGDQQAMFGVAEIEPHFIKPLQHKHLGFLEADPGMGGERGYGHGVSFPPFPTGGMCFEPQVDLGLLAHRLFAVHPLRSSPPGLDSLADSAPAALVSRLRSFLQAGHPLVQLRALLLLAVGWLLSPLCWWNDLVINLPLAWGFAKAVELVRPAWFTPALVLGYWLSNLLGILLMQSGALTVFRQSNDAADPRRELLTGLLTATLYTLAILLLVRSGLVPTPLLPQA